SGEPLAPAVSWQCNRSAEVVERLRCAGHEAEVRRHTGLPLHPYFSAGKMAWLLENVPAVGDAAARGTLRLGTVDAWLTSRLAGEPLTDPSTASRTQLLDLDETSWSAPMLDLFAVPGEALPRIVDTAGPLGVLRHPAWGPVELPLTALACDQQAALAGHGAFAPGAIKATYGTGVFVLESAGPARPAPDDRLLTTIAWRLAGETTYAVDGGVFSAGTLLDWLVRLGILDGAAASEAAARAVDDAAGVQLLPALGGLGAPWWRPDATATVSGLSLATRREHVVRAALDGIAQRTADVVETMLDAGQPPDALRVDGGLSANGYLMERQADLLGLTVDVASVADTTALGIAGLAGIGVGRIGPKVIAAANPVARHIQPALDERARRRERATWRSFVEWASQPAADGERREALRTVNDATTEPGDH
ncbi:MAG TPA: FGGY-family carbohydrate kinase, partial [Candidatus Limnocylindria bacterium]|nr:FGGY-family carbohydrate kinase [Candidatus Limnocylindria bacterium]